MDKRFQPSDFIERMHDKSLTEVLDACAHELTEAQNYQAMDQVEVCYIDVYKEFLHNLQQVLTLEQKPLDVNDHELQKTKPVVERLVAHKELDADILNIYLH